MGKKIINVALFQAAWFAAVLGAAGGHEFYGPMAVGLVLPLHFTLIDDLRGEFKLLLVAAILGFFFDTALMTAGVFTPRSHLLPQPFSPPWMVSLWVNFAATLNVSLAWLRGRYYLAALFGAIGGPAAYYSGAKLGATLALPGTGGVIILAAGWGVMTPLLVWLARVCASKTERTV
jgi:hypothetical protein